MSDSKNLAVIADNIEYLAVVIARCTRALIQIYYNPYRERMYDSEQNNALTNNNIEDDMAVRRIFLENQDKEVK